MANPLWQTIELHKNTAMNTEWYPMIYEYELIDLVIQLNSEASAYI